MEERKELIPTGAGGAEHGRADKMLSGGQAWEVRTCMLVPEHTVGGRVSATDTRASPGQA